MTDTTLPAETLPDASLQFSRQAGYVNHEWFGDIILAGCGSVGRQIALCLRSMGLAAKMAVYDPDNVGRENLATQGWNEADIGLPKVDALGDGFREYVQDRYYGAQSASIVILPLDSARARRMIVERLQSHDITPPELIVDPRQSPTSCRIVCFAPERGGDWASGYLSSLPPDEDRTGCVRPQTYYQSLITAGLACRCVALHTMGLDASCDIVYDGGDTTITNLAPETIPPIPDRSA